MSFNQLKLEWDEMSVSFCFR